LPCLSDYLGVRGVFVLFRKGIIAWIVEFCKIGGGYILQKLLLTGKRISLRTPTHDDLPILHNLIYGVENPEWKKYDAPLLSA
jgi:hypothetical protein